MSVQIELDNRNTVFTCLDYMTGKVVLSLPSDDTVASITVKMEGIAFSRLAPPREDCERRDRRRPEVETHRVLYLVETVFPSEAIREQTTTGFTLKAGQYEYPFTMRIPINVSCTEPGGIMNKFSLDKSATDFSRDASLHTRGTLPPSLSGIPGDQAWIRYFLKVTVNRPKFYKTNLRRFDPFVFLPIDPPRPPSNKSETYGRRRHEFFTPALKERSLFNNPFRRAPVGNIPVRFAVEARLPNPSILVPSDPIPLRIILNKTDPFPDVIFMRMLQITLLADTQIRAHELLKVEPETMVLLSVSDLQIPIGDENSVPGQELEVNSIMWLGRSLPETVPPSFTTCNISRSYSLKVDIGLSCGGLGHVDIIPIVLPIQVYSGIKPPQKLLEAAQPRIPRQPPRPSINTSLTAPAYMQSPTSPKLVGKKRLSSHSEKDTRVPSLSSPEGPPQRPHSSQEVPSIDGDHEGLAESAPPPTYEDAIGTDVAPIDGPRRRYEQEGGYYGDLPSNLGDAH